MARLTSPDGIAVQVDDDLADEMVSRGFVLASESGKPAPKKAAAKPDNTSK